MESECCECLCPDCSKQSKCYTCNKCTREHCYKECPFGSFESDEEG